GLGSLTSPGNSICGTGVNHVPPVCTAHVLYCALKWDRCVALKQDTPHLPEPSRSREEAMQLRLFVSLEPWRPFCELRIDQSQSLAPGFSQSRLFHSFLSAARRAF